MCMEHAAMDANIRNSQNENVRNLMAMVNDAENSIDAMFGLAPRRPMQIPIRQQVIHAPQTTVNDHSIHIDHSMVGVVNSGTVGTLNASVSLIQQTNPEMAEQIRTLIDQVSSNQDLEQATRKEVIEQVSFLMSQMSVPSAERNSSVLKTVFSAIGITLSTSADLYTLWEALHPALATLLA